MNLCLERGRERLVLRLVCCCLSIGLVTGMAGCGKRIPRSVEHTEVSGKVLFQGKPLPGGKVTFVAINGGFASFGIIDENGNYQINAPVGEVEIGVNNQMLRPRSMAAPRLEKAASAQEEDQPLKKQPLKGRYVPIPFQYVDPHTSCLKYTVKPGPQTHDIELSANPSPTPAAPGQ